jgi:HEPN domain-containing protein
MNVKRFPPDDPREWLNRAKSNLRQARSETEGVYLEDLCYDAQQAAEKAIKAVLIHRKVRFPYVHDLAELVTLLRQPGQALPPSLEEAAKLTRYAVASRYPGFIEAASREEHQEAVAIAESVIRWAEGVLGPESASSSTDPGAE